MAVNKVIYHGNTLIDLTSSTVTPGALALGVTAKNAKGETITGTVPVMGTVANKVITLSGELANGTYTIAYGNASGTLVVANYTNQIPISTDTDGSIYNGTGYMAERRIGSSGTVSTLSVANSTNPVFVTGFIPIKSGDVVRMKNCYIDTSSVANGSTYGQNGWSVRIGYYKSNKTFDNSSVWTDFAADSTFATNVVVDSNGLCSGFTFSSKIDSYAYKYVRFTLAGTPATAIITINEPME